MPVRLMEEAIRRGPGVAPAADKLLGELLPRVRSGDSRREPVWLVILLGELGWSGAVPSLLSIIEEAEPRALGLPGAAAEALAKIGGEAVDGLIALLDRAPAHRRLWVYGALNDIDDPRAQSNLLSALRGDPELETIVASGSVAPSEASAEAPSDWTPLPDFRLRYRPLPWLGVWDPGWAGWMVLEHLEGRPLGRSRVPHRPFPRVLPTPPPKCACCGAPVTQAVGTLVCPALAVFTVAYFHRTLVEAQQVDGFDDMFEVLDAVERTAVPLVLRSEPPDKEERREWTGRLAEICDVWQSMVWLVEKGIEEVGRARERLLDELYLAAGIYGDPHRLVAWSETGPSRVPPIWRRSGRSDRSGRGR